MKVSLNWIKQFTDVDISVDELVEKIGAQLGAVEEVIDIGKKYQGIVIARVVSCEKHPNADKLSVCKIDDAGKAQNVERDESGHVQVVCGAPNVRKDLLVAWLPPGATVPSSFDKDPFVLEARELRGVTSNGMIASAHELAISDDHSGIVEIDIPAEPGSDFAETYELNDYVIDIENKMFTHRPDCFGVLGVAREIAGIQNVQFNSPDWYMQALDRIKPGKTKLPLEISSDIAEVPRFMAVALADVHLKPSPLIMQSYLSRVGLKPINNIVDVTNYLMMLTAQPLHAYDYDKLPAKSLETRKSKKGDKLKLLSGKEVAFEDDRTILITSGDVPVGIGGVMGGADTEVDENTKNIVLECANFDMYSIRKTAMKYGLFTDAVTRFNKGQSPLQNDVVLEEAVATLQYVSGGQVASEIFDIKSELKDPRSLQVSSDFINARLGLQMSAADMATLLQNVEFKTELQGSTLYVLKITAPFWRTDIEIAEDIVEEAGRLYGYDKLPLELPQRSIKPAKRDELLDFKAKLRDILSRAGANEVLTYSFVHGNLLDKVGQDKEKAYRLSNALSPDLQYYRLSLLPSLLDKVYANIKAGFSRFAIFELGKSHIKGLMSEDEKDIPAEQERVALVFAADNKTAKAAQTGAPYYQAMRYLDELLANLKIEYGLVAGSGEAQSDAHRQLVQPFAPGRHAFVTVNGQPIGVVGEIKYEARRSLKLPAFTAAFELNLLELLASQGSPAVYQPLPRFPKVIQDISLRFNSDTPNESIHEFMVSQAKTLRLQGYFTDWDYLDIYQNTDRGTYKHVAFRLVLASYERTLTAQEASKLLDEIAKSAGNKFGAERI